MNCAVNWRDMLPLLGEIFLIETVSTKAWSRSVLMFHCILMSCLELCNHLHSVGVMSVLKLALNSTGS